MISIFNTDKKKIGKEMQSQTFILKFETIQNN